MNPLVEKLSALKKGKNAILIAHYYQESQIQDVADYIGDSYGMALYAAKQEAKIAIVAGVKFMGETIKVLNPNKKILLPDLNAGCSLADSCTPQVFAHFKSKYPDSFVMTYINSSLAIKAMSDVICTSSNAVKIASQIPENKTILFGPDQHLGRYISKKLGRKMVLFPGNCFVHTSFSYKELAKIKAQYPRAAIIAHPECEDSILSQADFIGSTSGLLTFTQESDFKQFIVMTEAGIIHQMKLKSPEKEFFLGPDLEGCACNECPHMKLNTLEKVVSCLENESPEIIINEKEAALARPALDRMIEMAGN
ncbi:MAG: hypothetical protein ACD_73C00630G0003 [uncultured bacterium]|nr:MAG: hypothetical protein ACD_73C00630G0003 [uncultured bacterium]